MYEFYGTECPHCMRMQPIVEKLRIEGFSIESFETWHNEENEKKRQDCDRGYCGGVPFFYNTETRKWICGETTYEELKALVEGK